MVRDRPSEQHGHHFGGLAHARALTFTSILIAAGVTASCYRVAYLDPDGRAIREPPLVATFEHGWIVVDTTEGRTRAILKLEWPTPDAGLHLDPGALALWAGASPGLEPLRRSVGESVCRAPARRRARCGATVDEKRRCPQTQLPPEERCVHEIRAVFLLDTIPKEGDQLALRVGGRIVVLRWSR